MRLKRAVDQVRWILQVDACDWVRLVHKLTAYNALDMYLSMFTYVCLSRLIYILTTCSLITTFPFPPRLSSQNICSSYFCFLCSSKLWISLWEFSIQRNPDSPKSDTFIDIPVWFFLHQLQLTYCLLLVPYETVLFLTCVILTSECFLLSSRFPSHTTKHLSMSAVYTKTGVPFSTIPGMHIKYIFRNKNKFIRKFKMYYSNYWVSKLKIKLRIWLPLKSIILMDKKKYHQYKYRILLLSLHALQISWEIQNTVKFWTQNKFICKQ